MAQLNLKIDTTDTTSVVDYIAVATKDWGQPRKAALYHELSTLLLAGGGVIAYLSDDAAFGFRLEVDAAFLDILRKHGI